MGGIDPNRMSAAIEQLGANYEFKNAPDASLYFTDDFLPEGNFPIQ